MLVVDDEPDLRALITTVLELDGRYLVIGEARDGVAAIERAAALQPEVVVLDRSMPGMNGLEALPGIRDVAPNAAVIVYTAENDRSLQQAAMGSGAVGVLMKDGSVKRLAALLSDALLRSAATSSTDLAVEVGPVPSDAALEWIDNSRKIIEAVGSSPAFADVDITPEIIETFSRYLESWREVAEADREFVWAARASAEDVEHLLEAWVAIDAVDTARLRAVGLDWSSPRGTLFKDALTAAVLEVLQRQEALRSVTERLQRLWER